MTQENQSLSGEIVDSQGSGTNNEVSSSKETSMLIKKANEAYEADDSKTVIDLCNKVLEDDPENAEAWELL